MTNDPVKTLSERLRASEQRFRLVVKLGRVVNSSLDLGKVFRHAARGIRPLFHCDLIRLLLPDPPSATAWGFALEYADTVRWSEIAPHPVAASAAGVVLAERRPRLVRLDQSRLLADDQLLFEAGYRCRADLPLVCRDRAVGVLGVAARDAHRIEAWDFELLTELGNVLATALDNAAAYTEIAALKAQLEKENRYLREEVQSADIGGLIGDSPAMHAVHAAIAQVAQADSTVLILGETGVGKELVARAIHKASPRRDHLLVKVNCAALAPGVLTSELFGHEIGAFTGAVHQRTGRFELAHHGTLFLDEIAEMPLEAQVLLLRVLQERVIERVGGQEPIPVDVRLITATNRDLAGAVREQRFRADLFYRLNVFPLRVPLLRERREDIPALVRHFLAQLARRVGKNVPHVTPRTMDLLTRYPWPGNVRELENIVERGLIVSGGDTLEIDPTWLADPTPADGARGPLAERERQAILEALRQTGGKVYGPGGAAALLGLKPTTLYGKMRKHDIHKRGAVD